MIDCQKTQQVTQWQVVLRALSNLSYQTQDLSSYLHELICGVSQLLESDWSIVTVVEESEVKIIASSLEIDEADLGFLVHESVSENVIQSGRPFFIENIQHYPEEVRRMDGYVCYLGVPMRVSQGNIIGTICSFSMQPHRYDNEIIATIELFAERAATAIDNHRLYQQQQKFNHRLEAEVTKRTIELREAQAKLIEHERLAAIGEFSTMIVHEIRNPLTTVQMGLDYFKTLNLSQAAQTRLSLAREEATRLANLLQEILLYSKPQILHLFEIEINSFIQELLVSLRLMPEAQGRSIEYYPSSSPVQILGEPDKLKQVFINLIRNACEAVEIGDTIHWTVAKRSLEQICISVHNRGLPIPKEVLPRLTQPFYSTKAEGTGLGLAIVKRIVEAHNGQLLIESSELKGTIFSVCLPLQ